jgi:hypothetical protein
MSTSSGSIISDVYQKLDLALTILLTKGDTRRKAKAT